MTGVNDTVTALEARFPRWQIWVVHRTHGGILWCGRLWALGDDGSHSLNADSPEELAAKIDAAQGEGFLP